LEHSDFV